MLQRTEVAGFANNVLFAAATVRTYRAAEDNRVPVPAARRGAGSGSGRRGGIGSGRRSGSRSDHGGHVIVVNGHRGRGDCGHRQQHNGHVLPRFLQRTHRVGRRRRRRGDRPTVISSAARGRSARGCGGQLRDGDGYNCDPRHPRSMTWRRTSRVAGRPRSPSGHRVLALVVVLFTDGWRCFPWPSATNKASNLILELEING